MCAKRTAAGSKQFLPLPNRHCLLFLLLLLAASSFVPIAEASHEAATSAGAGGGIANSGAAVPNWQPPMAKVPSTASADGAQKNDTCYNRDNCEACWKDECFALADAAYEECMATDMASSASIQNNVTRNATDTSGIDTSESFAVAAVGDAAATADTTIVGNANTTATNNTNTSSSSHTLWSSSLYQNETQQHEHCTTIGTQAYQSCGHACYYCNATLKSCTTSDLLSTIDLRTEANQWANEESPPPYVAFAIGGAFAILAAVHWLVRFHRSLNRLDPRHRRRKGVLFRAALVTLGDDDEPLFTILRMMSQGFLLLGGFQIDYHTTLLVLLGIYFFISLRDTFRVLVAYHANKKVDDYVVVSKRQEQIVVQSKQANNKSSWIELKTKNIYENLSRDFVVVAMVFVTQALLIAFVIVDVYHSKERNKSIFSSDEVPVVGTRGSYLIYILGIFMSIVYLVGPKTSFGQSKENPHYWVQLLLIAKLTGATCSWNNPVEGIDKTIQLRPGDRRIWIRFVLSFLINGYAFHVLVHLLPIQVASESSWTGVVFRNVGMMFLIDMDATPSVTLTLHEYLDDDNHDEDTAHQSMLGTIKEGGLSSNMAVISSKDQQGGMEMALELNPIVEEEGGNSIGKIPSSSIRTTRTDTFANEDIMQSLRMSSLHTDSTMPSADAQLQQQGDNPLPSSRAAARGNILLDLANIDEPAGNMNESPVVQD